MASGDVVVAILQATPPGANNATLDVRIGGSTPTEAVPLIDFDAASDEYYDFLCVLLPNYAGGGLTFVIPYSMSVAVANSVRIELAVRRFQEDAEDVDDAHAYDYNGVTDTVPNVSGEVSYPTLTFTDGADMDSLAAGELAVLRVHRDYDHVDDTAAGDLELWMNSILGRET